MVDVDGVHVAADVVEQPRRERRHQAAAHPVVFQHAVDEGAAAAPVAVREGVDGLELAVEAGGLDHGVDVVPPGERAEVVHEGGHAPRLGRHEEGPVGAVGGAAHPDLLLPEPPGPAHEGPVDRDDRVAVHGALDLQGPAHGMEVPGDEARVFREVAGHLGPGHVPGARREVLDLGARRRLPPQEDGRKVVAALRLLGVEAGELPAGLGDQGPEVGVRPRGGL